VNYGATAGPPEKIDMFKVFWKQLTLCGSTMGSPAEFAKMLEFVSQHTIRPVVDKTYPLPEGNEALARMNRGDQRGKIVLVVG
jgi:zinc-binding alcohol dehydrogenase/oxidoreductase